jgi:RHS repeat-associated protein
MLVYGTQADANPAHSDIGTPLAAYDYRAFGEMIELTPPPTGKVTENFTGKEHDDEIALDYFGARYLDPMLGMWISVDPKREYFSPYIYLRGNPLNLIDPTGMAEADPEIAKISPKAADYINSFEPNEYELQTFVETYALFDGLTTDFLKNNILKNLTVLYGEYPKPNKEVNGYFDLKDGYAIRMTKKGLDTSPTAGDWQTRIRSTIYHELSHFLNFLWLGKTGIYVYPKYELSDGILTDVYVDPKTHRPTFSDLGKEIEVKLYGKDY